MLNTSIMHKHSEKDFQTLQAQFWSMKTLYWTSLNNSLQKLGKMREKILSLAHSAYTLLQVSIYITISELCKYFISIIFFLREISKNKKFSRQCALVLSPFQLFCRMQCTVKILTICDFYFFLCKFCLNITSYNTIREKNLGMIHKRNPE